MLPSFLLLLSGTGVSGVSEEQLLIIFVCVCVLVIAVYLM